MRHLGFKRFFYVRSKPMALIVSSEYECHFIYLNNVILSGLGAQRIQHSIEVCDRCEINFNLIFFN